MLRQPPPQAVKCWAPHCQGPASGWRLLGQGPFPGDRGIQFPFPSDAGGSPGSQATVPGAPPACTKSPSWLAFPRGELYAGSLLSHSLLPPVTFTTACECCRHCPVQRPHVWLLPLSGSSGVQGLGFSVARGLGSLMGQEHPCIRRWYHTASRWDCVLPSFRVRSRS